MKKSVLFCLVFISLLTLASATISLDKEPTQVYNLGDNIELLLKIIASPSINNILTINLNCGSVETEVYKEYIYLMEGEKSRDITIPLIKSFIGASNGTCSINYELGTEKGSLGSEFTISNQIDIIIQEPEQEYMPGETVTIVGTAIKKNLQGITGTIEANMSTEITSNLIYSNLIENGNFNLKISLPQNIKAGDHQIILYTYEKNSDEVIINRGILITSITVKQVPTNLEIVLDSVKIDPGETLKLKAILHDQTGENMVEKVYFSIKNPEGQVIEKIEKTTGEYLEYYINSSTLPSVWRINAYSGELSTNTAFTINEKKQIKTEILNSTVKITNTGNIVYQDILDVKIGEEIRKIELSLDIGESKIFTLTAPKGEYLVQIGEESKTVGLTGNSVDVKKFTENAFALKPFIWIFIIIILGLIAYMVFKKGYKRTFFGRRHHIGPHIKSIKLEREKNFNSSKGKLINPQMPVELSLSIHGNKQTSEIIGVHLKNYEEASSGEGGTKETFSKITHLAEEHKAIIYQNKDHIFFIFAPEKTRTFKNQETAISLARDIIKILEGHNKLFKQKIEYGIAIDSGDIILKQDVSSIKFTAITSLMTNIKRMSMISHKQIYLSEKVRNDLSSRVKVEKIANDKIHAYLLKEIISQPDHSKFIRGFMDRLERDRKS